MKEHKNRAWPQYVAVTSACLAMVCNGSALGWISPTMELLLSDESPIPMTYSDLSWITAALSIGVAIAAVFTASTIDRIGRKPVILLSSLCYIISWICVIFANNLILLYAYKLFGGFALGSSLSSNMIYIGEAVESSRRGKVGILGMLFMSFGLIFELILGPRVTFMTLNVVSLAFPIIFFLTFIFMPESPHFLISKGLDNRAYASLMWLRGQSEIKSVEEEMTDIKIFVKSKSKLNLLQTLKEITLKKNRRAIILISIVIFGSEISGSTTITSFAERIFVQIDSPINPPDAVVLLNIVGLIFALSTMFIVDKIGRKILLIVSLLGCTLSHTLVATYLFLLKNGTIGAEFSWMALTGLFSFTIFYWIGISSVPRILMSEIFPNETKAWSNCLAILLQSLIGFNLVKIFQIVDESVGVYASFILFASGLFVTCIIIVFIMPETKNKTFNEIQKILQGTKYIDKENEK